MIRGVRVWTAVAVLTVGVVATVMWALHRGAADATLGADPASEVATVSPAPASPSVSSSSASSSAAPVKAPAGSAASPAPLYSIDHGVPGTTSGPLSGADMPAPAVLGAGWATRTDPGNPEDGYQGNGTPNVARNPSEVAAIAVPLGCLTRTSLPVPRWALESDYVHQPDGTYAVAVRLRFATVAQARAFMSGRDHDLGACTGQPAPAGLVQHLTRGADDTVSTRTDAGSLTDGSAWTELASRRGSDVLLVAANTPSGGAGSFVAAAVAGRVR
jgi:hypothetical protein